MKDNRDDLVSVFREWSGEACRTITPLPASGSDRKYWRLEGSSSSAIGAYHPVPEERKAFLEFTRHFKKTGLPVPELYYYSTEEDFYLMQDLGDTTLYSLLQTDQQGTLPPPVFGLFERSLDALVKFQVAGGRELDYSVCYPRGSFDRQSLIWDLNYFKYNFLKLQVNFHEQRLEEDFERLMDYMLKAPSGYFMYRDFQSRNIMVKDGELYFIDYQGGRKGPLQYDPVSLLFQVKAGLSPQTRAHLLDKYLDALQSVIKIDRSEFKEYVDGFILLRLLQVFGAYGFRGLVQRKTHFVTSLPYAVKTLQWYLQNKALPVKLPELVRGLEEIANSGRFDLHREGQDDKLTVNVMSFSYKNGLPEDSSAHGGGFVFDCRALPNPGREESLRRFTGHDAIIRNYLSEKSEVVAFLGNIFSILEQSVDNYLDRGFGSLSASFGCTGGQHRSVFCAESLASHLRNKYPGIIVRVNHRELKML